MVIPLTRSKRVSKFFSSFECFTSRLSTPVVCRLYLSLPRYPKTRMTKRNASPTFQRNTSPFAMMALLNLRFHFESWNSVFIRKLFSANLETKIGDKIIICLDLLHFNAEKVSRHTQMSSLGLSLECMIS